MRIKVYMPECVVVAVHQLKFRQAAVAERFGVSIAVILLKNCWYTSGKSVRWFPNPPVAAWRAASMRRPRLGSWPTRASTSNHPARTKPGFAGPRGAARGSNLSLVCLGVHRLR